MDLKHEEQVKSTESDTQAVALPVTSESLNEAIEFEPLTSTLLVQQIQAQLNPDSSASGTSESEEKEENLVDSREKQSESDEKTTNESKIDEKTELEISSAQIVEAVVTQLSENSHKNNNNDDEYINKNLKVAEKEGNDDSSKDILEYLVTFSDSADKNSSTDQKESELSDKPPIPLPTYLWEDVKKAKEQGAYPWTHLYKRKLDPADDFLVFSTFPKKSSPKTPKKVRIQEETLQTGSTPNLYEPIEKLETTFEKEEAQKVSSETEEPVASSSSSKVAAPASPKSILKRSGSHETEDTHAVAAGSSKTPKLKERLKSFNENIKTFSGKQMEKLGKAKGHIKKIKLPHGKKIEFHDKQKILHLKRSPKSAKHEFVSYLEKQDSDVSVEIAILEDSPSNARKNMEHEVEEKPVPDEIIELNKDNLEEDQVVPSQKFPEGEKIEEIPESESSKGENVQEMPVSEPPKEEKAEISQKIDDEVELNFTEQTVPQIIEPPTTPDKKVPPPKAPRKQKGHVYEDIEDASSVVPIDPLILDFMGGPKDLKESLKVQDQLILKELKQKSEEEEDALSALTSEVNPNKAAALLAPISSIDSTSSDEGLERKTILSALIEESDTGISDVEGDVKVSKAPVVAPVTENPVSEEKKEEISVEDEPEVPELTPLPDEKVEEMTKPEIVETENDEKVKEDVEPKLKVEIPEPSPEKIANKWAAMSDHEYEPIGQPEDAKLSPPSPDVQMSAQEFQLHLEDKFFNNQAHAHAPNPEVVITAPSFDETSKSGTSTEPEKRKKSFMASAQEQGRLFQRKLSSQADNIKTKIGNLKKPKQSEGEVVEETVTEEVVVVETPTSEVPSEATGTKKRFQKPDFSKLKGHLPEFKRPEMPKLKKPNFDKIKAMKRPTLPDMPKVDFNKHLQNVKKLGRSKSMKEEKTSDEQPETSRPVLEVTEIEEEVVTTTGTVPTKKKRFDVETFRTYPRMITNKFKKSKKSTSPAKKLTPILKPRAKGSKQEVDTESGQFTEYNKDIDLDRETSVERRMRVHLEKAIEEYRQIEEEETKLAKQESLPRKKKGKKVLPQPESFDSRDFDFNQNEMDSEGASKASTQELHQIRPSFGRTDTQSLKSGDRHGVLEEIDDDQFFLRKKGISEDNIQMGEYISSAIREGLMDPVNVLAQMGDQYDEDYQLDEEEMRYLEELQKQGSDFQLELDANLMPHKPGRRSHTKKQSSDEISDEQMTAPHKWTPIKDIDEDSIEISHRDFSRFVPPTPPRRRKKRTAPLPKTATKGMNGYEELPDVPSHQEEVIVFRQMQPNVIPLAKAESGEGFVPVAPRRSRSRSHSVLKDENRPVNAIENEVPGYAVIKKDPPPRPPAPQPRRSKSTRFHERPFNTMPHLKSNDESKPERPARNYSTIVPDRPPKRPVSDIEQSRTTPYEEISDTSNDDIVKKLQSGEVLSKMKDRPLPAPPRPTRSKSRKSEDPQQQPSQDDTDDRPDDNNDDKGGSAVRGILETADSFTSNEYKVEEIDASCQTDPLPDDFQLEELEVTEDMRTVTPTMYREPRPAPNSCVAERFSRPETPSIEQELQRIRDGRPASRHSHKTAGSRTPSRPTTPALVYVERKITTPLFDNSAQVEASLTAHQVEIDFDEETGNVIIMGIVDEKQKPHSTEEQKKLDDEERQEYDLLKSIEDEIIRDVLSDEPKEPQMKASHEHKSEAQKEPVPVEEPKFEAVRAPIRPQPVVQLPPVEHEPEILRTEQQPATITPQSIQQLSTPDHPLHLSNLSVDRLSVNDLQASKISVSELDSSTINSREIQCQSGNLNMRSLEIPPGVIEEIVDRVQRMTQAGRHSPVSTPPASFYELQNPNQEPVAPPRRQKPSQQQQEQSTSQQPSILSLTGQLASACGTELQRQGSNLVNYLQSLRKTENRHDKHFVLFFLIIIIAGLFMIGMDRTDKTVHHHHWDFFNPPKNGEQK